MDCSETRDPSEGPRICLAARRGGRALQVRAQSRVRVTKWKNAYFTLPHESTALYIDEQGPHTIVVCAWLERKEK